MAPRARRLCLTDGDPRCLALLQAAADVMTRWDAVPCRIDAAPLSFGDNMLRVHGEELRFDLIVAADVLYNSQDAPSLVTPCSGSRSLGCAAWGLWESVSSLLLPVSKNPDSQPPQFLLGYMHRHDDIMAEFVEESNRRGFHAEQIERIAVTDPAAPDLVRPMIDCSVYVFTRRT